MSVKEVVEEGLGEVETWPNDGGEVLNENEVLGTGDEESTENGLGVVIKADEDSKEDLFEAALTESGGGGGAGGGGVGGKESGAEETKPAQTETPTRGIYGPINNQQYQGRRYFCYVGNMTWWTNDEDLASMVNGTGLRDLLDIKFYENRSNGQSKGFALLVFASDASVRAVMEKLPKLSIHGQQLIVLPYTKQAQAQLEAATRKPGDKSSSSSSSSTAAAAAAKGQNFMGTIRLGQQAPALPPPPNNPGQPGPPLLLRPPQPGGALMGQAPRVGVGPVPAMPLVGVGGAPPPVLPGQPPRLLPPPPQQRLPPPPQLPPQQRPPPPTSHPQMAPQGPVPLIPPPTNRPPPGLPPPNPGNPQPPSLLPPLRPMQQPPPGAYINPHVYRPPGAPNEGLSESEFEEIMSRNRTVSSSAISRAVSDAAAGDYASAIETLVTAISLIRQSRVANDDRCKVLIHSLQDTLHGIESKSYGGGGGGGKRRGRSRSPSRSSSKRYRRSSRSRSRSRERYDDYRSSSSSRRY